MLLDPPLTVLSNIGHDLLPLEHYPQYKNGSHLKCLDIPLIMARHMYFNQEGANVKINVKERNFVSTPSRIVIVQNLKFPNRVKPDESNQWSYWRILIYVDKFVSNIKVNLASFFLTVCFVFLF